MLSLAWEIEDVVEFNGVKYKLNLEFSNVLRWYETVYKDDVSNQEKVIDTLTLIYQMDIEEMVKLEEDELIFLFVSALKAIFPEDDELENEDRSSINSVNNAQSTNNSEPIVKYYDFIEDAEYIFASFLFDYNINLIDERRKGTLHWDAFIALLTSLSEDSKLQRVISIRKMKIFDKATEEEKKAILDAKKSVALKENRESIEFESMDLLQKREWYEKQQNKGGEMNG